MGPELTLRMKQGLWDESVTLLDEKSGTLETGSYPESNIQGVRLRAVYSASQARLRLQVKAAGPYYADLGAQAHMSSLIDKLVPCIEA